MTHLFLIRHGESYANIDPTGTVAGIEGDKGLTPLGRRQAERLRDRLAASGEIAADVLIASTLPRARHTAEIIAPALDLPIRFDDDVQELRPGEADGLSIAEAQERFGFLDLRKEPYVQVAPGGENWGQFVLRVGTTLDRITREHAGKTIAVVTHGGFIDSTFLVFLQMHTLVPPPVDFYTHNTSITHWEQVHHGDTVRWRLVRYNDDAHVRDILIDHRELWEQALERAEAPEEHPAVPIPTEERGTEG
jgi:probable phosphoglycerate mutase